MSEISDVMEALVATVTAAVPSLHGYPYLLPTVRIPAVVAVQAEDITYGETMSGDATLLTALRFYVQRTQDGADQRLLNEYISRDGPSSVVAALEGDPTLGGVVSDVRVVNATNFGNWPIGSTTYLGVELRLAVMLA